VVSHPRRPAGVANSGGETGITVVSAAGETYRAGRMGDTSTRDPGSGGSAVPLTEILIPPSHVTRPDGAADRFMRRLLRLPEDGPAATAADARRALRTSILVTTVRCLLMYIVLPFVLPAIGVATDAAPAIVLPINVLAMVMIVMSVRRFWRAEHPKRWWYTALGTTVLGFLVYLVVTDIMQLA